MSVDEELTAIERSVARSAVRLAESSRWLYALYPGFPLVTGILYGTFTYPSPLQDPSTAFWNGGAAGMTIAIGISLLLDYPLVRALGVLYRRVGGSAETPTETAPRPSVRRASLPLRNACLVAFASGLGVCGVALWRFGSGELAPAWAGIAMGAAGGFGAGAALVASFLPRWMERVAQLEAQPGAGVKD